MFLLAVFAPISLRFVPKLRAYQFTAWIVAAVTCPMLFPGAFLDPEVFGRFTIPTTNGWVKLIIIQLVMFGMGTQMSIRDFAGVAKMPHGVIVGLVCQFTIMPLVGFGLAMLLGLKGEIGAGLVLIGSCSSGLASNVMAHMGRLNLPLSITLTACATALAPLITPAWLTVLGDKLDIGDVVTYEKAMMSIIKIVVAPIGAALIHDYLKRAAQGGRAAIWITGAVGAVWLLFLKFGGWSTIQGMDLSSGMLNSVKVIGFLLAAVLVGAIYHQLTRAIKKLDGMMPLFSMFGIIYFTALSTAAGRDALMAVVVALCIGAVAHNTIGYVLGYWLSRLMRLKPHDARTIAMEVGLQNGGMAFGIAADLQKIATLGLAPVIFSAWMNISGSVLANFWRRNPVKE